MKNKHKFFSWINPWNTNIKYMKYFLEFFYWLHHVGPFPSTHWKYILAKLLRIKTLPFSSKEVGKYHKGTPQYSWKIGKSFPEYLILQGRSDFGFSIKIQNTSILQVTKHTFHGATNFDSVIFLSSEQTIF